MAGAIARSRFFSRSALGAEGEVSKGHKKAAQRQLVDGITRFEVETWRVADDRQRWLAIELYISECVDAESRRRHRRVR